MIGLGLFGGVADRKVVVASYPGTDLVQVDVVLPVVGARPVGAWRPGWHSVSVLPWCAAWLDAATRRRLAGFARHATGHHTPHPSLSPFASGSVASGRSVTGAPGQDLPGSQAAPGEPSRTGDPARHASGDGPEPGHASTPGRAVWWPLSAASMPVSTPEHKGVWNV